MLTPVSFPQRRVSPTPPSQKKGSLNPSMINESLKVTCVPLSLKVEDVDATAHYLVEKFRNPEGLRFYQKVAWYIPRGTIDRLVALAFDRGSNPARYFTALTRKEMEA